MKCRPVLGMVLALACLSVCADQGDTINFNAMVGAMRDNNLFRLAPQVSPRPLVGRDERGDQITTTALGVGFQKGYGLQQFEAGWDHISYRYSTYSFLNSEVDNGHAAWRWQLTPRVKGNLTYNQNQALVGFADYTNYGSKNLRTTTVVRGDADWNLFNGGWHLTIGADQYEVRNSQAYTQDQGSRTQNVDATIRYHFPSDNWVGGFMRSGSGQVLGNGINVASQLDSGFDEQRYEARAYWTRGKSTLYGAVGYAARHYDHFSSRDYGGGVGNLAWVWTISGKSMLQMTWRRDLSGYTDQISSYYQQDSYSIKPVWQIDGKLKLSGSIDYACRDYRGAVTSLPYIHRNEHVTTARLDIDWVPFRALSANAYVLQERRDSSLPAGDYTSRQAGVNLRAEF